MMVVVDEDDYFFPLPIVGQFRDMERQKQYFSL